MRLLILFALLMCLACGPAHKLRKAERLMNAAIAHFGDLNITETCNGNYLLV